jgi:chromosomal replication initiator protein
VDVLLIDDVQFFAGKERVQEELLHTFTALYERGRQVVISSDRPPRELGTIDDGLRSRFEMGLVAEVGRPDLETRVAILRKLAETQQISIGDPTLLPFVAGRASSKVRELQGALTRLAAYSSLIGRPLDIELASELLPEAKETAVSIERIEEIVAASFGLPAGELRGRRRTSDVAYPRHVAMHLARELTGASLPSIGRHFGRDHTTVMYADRRLRRQMRDDPETRDLVEELTERVRHPR